MKIAISGARGFVGSRLIRAFEQQGWEVISLGRDAFRSDDELRSCLAGVDGVVHLAGEPIAARWTAAYKHEINESRIGTTKMLVDTMIEMPERPAFFLSTSAVGIYPPTIPCDEAQTQSMQMIFSGKLRRVGRDRLSVLPPRACARLSSVLAWSSVSAAVLCRRCCPRFVWGLAWS